ncbi:MAG: imidazole glycerol phosphate synthase subunit HisF [Rhodobacteraceae bacterium]|nr:imidazole glycerol phosphate synthase subunit HisF [Paracoccaceae bacterium]
MLRIIARLDIKNGKVIKGIQLEGQRQIGDPIEIARKYYEDGIDEILIMDSVASLYGRSNLFHLVAEACKTVFVPITIGGGIRSLEDVKDALSFGADKVAINTALVHDIDLLKVLVTTYGSQCIVGSIEAKKTGNGWQAYIDNGREPTGKDVIEWAKTLEQNGVGELLVTSVDKEGMQKGFDLPLYEALDKAVSIPIIASGGAGRVSHLKDLEQKTELQGIAIAAILHYAKCTVQEVKNELQRTTTRRKYVHAGDT